LPFFHQKSATYIHKIICETHDKNVIAIRMSANWFKRFKNCDFDIDDKNIRFAAVEEDELQKDGKKSWKTMENTSINLYCINFFSTIIKVLCWKKQRNKNFIILTILLNITLIFYLLLIYITQFTILNIITI